MRKNRAFGFRYDSEYECDTAKKGSSFEIDIWYYEDEQSIFVELFFLIVGYLPDSIFE